MRSVCTRCEANTLALLSSRQIYYYVAVTKLLHFVLWPGLDVHSNTGSKAATARTISYKIYSRILLVLKTIDLDSDVTSLTEIFKVNTTWERPSFIESLLAVLIVRPQLARCKL